MLYYQNFQKRNEFILQFNSIPRQKKYDNKKNISQSRSEYINFKKKRKKF